MCVCVCVHAGGGAPDERAAAEAGAAAAGEAGAREDARARAAGAREQTDAAHRAPRERHARCVRVGVGRPRDNATLSLVTSYVVLRMATRTTRLASPLVAHSPTHTRLTH